MEALRRAVVATCLLFAVGCGRGAGDSPIAPEDAAETGSRGTASPAGFRNTASGGYHFFIPEDFNGGIFGTAVDNRLTFQAKRKADGTVTGSFNYEQTEVERGIPYTYKGRVTCFKVYDTPILEDFEEIPPGTQNRAKWGGPIEKTNDPTVPVGTFAWFSSIDNGEGSKSPPDLSTIFGLGDEAANEAFCDSDRVPNPNFGPHAVQGNIQVR